jgi:dihydroorotate dehydrogenase
VGTANFVDPFVWPRLLEGLTAYLTRHGHRAVNDIVGAIDLPAPDAARAASEVGPR